MDHGTQHGRNISAGMRPCSIVNPKQSRKFTMKNRVALCVVVAVSFALSGYAASETSKDKPDTKGKKSSAEVVQAGDLTAKAISMPRVAIPADAKAAGASGAVKVQVQVDESGRVISANAISGHPALRQPAINAVRKARFTPTKLSGQPVKVTGIIQYNFVVQ